MALPPAGAPTLGALGSNTTGTFTVSWSVVAAATRYELRLSYNGGGWTLVQNTAATSKAYTDRPTGTYAFRVRACNDVGCSSDSAQQTATVTRPIPPPVPAPSVSNLGWGCQVTWATSAGAASYQVNTVGSLVYDGPDRSVILNGACGSTYVVRACNANGCSDWSPPGHGGGVIERHEGEGE